MATLASREEQPLSAATAHHAVLAAETLRLLDPRPGEVAVDATLGAGGHAELLLEALGPGGRLVGIDRDPRALELASARLTRFGAAFLPLRGNHRDLGRLLESIGIAAVDRLVFDLGMSSMQLDDPRRGFSFLRDGPLDMRMDPETGETAAELVARWSEREISEALWRYGEEPRARAIARAIVRHRAEQPILRTGELAEIVRRALGPAARRARIDPATRTFQALRIAVNREIEGLAEFIAEASMRLRPGGRIAVISFHSLEDRAVKTALRELARRCSCPPRLPVCGCGKQNLVRILTARPVGPSPAEIADNPRARSAKLRVAERL
jgi:16S rRNA (cytosine1402-N4)-methyltransferase